MAGSHISKEQTFTFARSNPHKLINVAAHMPPKDDLSWYDGPDFLDNYHSWNKLPNVIDNNIDSAEKMTVALITNQEYQNYYD